MSKPKTVQALLSTKGRMNTLVAPAGGPFFCPESTEDFITEYLNLISRLMQLANDKIMPGTVRQQSLKSTMNCLAQLERLVEIKRKEEKALEESGRTISIKEMIANDPQSAEKIINDHIEQLEALKKLIPGYNSNSGLEAPDEDSLDGLSF